MTIDEFLDLNHITVRPDPAIPASVRACCYHDDDGNDFILYNPAVSREVALSALLHELEHIRSGDMYDPSYREYEAFPGPQDIEMLKRLARAYTKLTQDLERVYNSFMTAI